MTMHDVVIVSAARTPIASFQGALSDFSAPRLGAIAIAGALSRAGIEGSDVDEVIMGNVLSGGLGQAPARQAAIYGGLPDSVPCLTINKVCGSGMKAIMLAAQSIALGDSTIVVAGGMESMTNAPYVLDKARAGYRMGNGVLVDTMINDGLWDPYNNCHMGNCGDSTAAELGYSRERLDEFAAESFARAKSAQAAGRFAEEIVSVSIPQRKGDPLSFESDEQPAKGGDLAKLATLRPAFSKDGVTTAGNASSINDGAGALVLMSAEEAAKRGLKPLGRIAGYATHAQEPTKFTTAPAEAINKLVAKAGIALANVDLFEINEAFAVVALGCAEKVGIPLEKLNVNGGAVALGHPIGMTGARLVMTSLLELRRRGGKYAISTPCIGGGEATAVLVEAL
ncbi:MAG: acetyl-CoA acetyltransferase [Armatimonadetes bacterium Cent15-Ar3]|nr:MAG: acetyl-CoA acetyltransferase [Armatimonadetes bacterium Cent15-Ar3]